MNTQNGANEDQKDPNVKKDPKDANQAQKDPKAARCVQVRVDGATIALCLSRTNEMAKREYDKYEESYYESEWSGWSEVTDGSKSTAKCYRFRCTTRKTGCQYIAQSTRIQFARGCRDTATRRKAGYWCIERSAQLRWACKYRTTTASYRCHCWCKWTANTTRTDTQGCTGTGS